MLIDRGAPVAWSAVSSDINILHFNGQGHLKKLFCCCYGIKNHTLLSKAQFCETCPTCDKVNKLKLHNCKQVQHIVVLVTVTSGTT